MEKSNKTKKPKILVIVGPTATGKSALAVRLAKLVGGEVVSADSRQIYKGLDIGSGKVTKTEMKGVPHHLLDIVTPKKTFTVAEFQRAGQKTIDDILKRGRVPIICGGSGFYIQALVDSVIFPDVLPDQKLRRNLEKKTLAELCATLKKLDPRRYKEIDKKNPRRLIRAIEIAKTLGNVPKINFSKAHYNPLFIGLTLPSDELREKINIRLAKSLKQGMIAEVKKLRQSGVSWKRLEKFGLEYRAVAEFLQNKISREEMIEGLQTDIWRFSKRQMGWFKRDKRIKWFKPSDWNKIKKDVENFLQLSR